MCVCQLQSCASENQENYAIKVSTDQQVNISTLFSYLRIKKQEKKKQYRLCKAKLKIHFMMTVVKFK